MANEKDLKKVFASLDAMLSNTDISDITADSNVGFSDLPAGYYLVEVKKAELKSSKDGYPQAAFQLKIVEDGLTIDEKGKMHDIEKTKDRMMFKYYTFKEERHIKQFVADMLKFEGEVPGEPILPKEAFTNSETIADAVEVLVGSRVYANLTISEKDDGSKNSWINIVSWKAAKGMGLPE